MLLGRGLYAQQPREAEKPLSETQKLALQHLAVLQQDFQQKSQAFVAEVCKLAGIELESKDGATCQIDPKNLSVFRQAAPVKPEKPAAVK